MLKQSLEMESSQMNERLGEATNQRAATEEAKHAAKGELEETTASEKSDSAYLADLKQSCAAKATEWSERQKSAAEEVAVIEGMIDKLMKEAAEESDAKAFCDV